MPELPEVETVVRGIRPALLGRTIQAAWTDWPKALITPDSRTFSDRIAGQKIEAVERRAKYILIKLSADWLIIHLKMTGRLYVVPRDAEDGDDRWVHFRFPLDNGQELRFSDSRKFGVVYLTENLERVTGKLGPEPLADTFTLEDFRRELARRKTKIKPLLLDQSFVAGVGNIYADEALHRAKIHPLRAANSLSEAEQAALYEAIKAVLHLGIERQGASIGWYRQPNGEPGAMQDAFWAYGRTGEPCLSCGTGIIHKIIVGQRGTHFCPTCQKEEAP